MILTIETSLYKTTRLPTNHYLNKIIIISSKKRVVHFKYNTYPSRIVKEKKLYQSTDHVILTHIRTTSDVVRNTYQKEDQDTRPILLINGYQN